VAFPLAFVLRLLLRLRVLFSWFGGFLGLHPACDFDHFRSRHALFAGELEVRLASGIRVADCSNDLIEGRFFRVNLAQNGLASG